MTSKLEVQEKVHFRGRLRGDPLYREFLMVDIYVMPAKITKYDTEGFGTVFLGAVLFGRPSIGTNSGGIPETVVDGVTSFLMPKGGYNQLMKEIRESLVGRQLGLKIGNAPGLRLINEFDHGKATDSLILIPQSEAHNQSEEEDNHPLPAAFISHKN